MCIVIASVAETSQGVLVGKVAKIVGGSALVLEGSFYGLSPAIHRGNHGLEFGGLGQGQWVAEFTLDDGLGLGATAFRGDMR